MLLYRKKEPYIFNIYSPSYKHHNGSAWKFVHLFFVFLMLIMPQDTQSNLIQSQSDVVGPKRPAEKLGASSVLRWLIPDPCLSPPPTLLNKAHLFLANSWCLLSESLQGLKQNTPLQILISFIAQSSMMCLMATECGQ